MQLEFVKIVGFDAAHLHKVNIIEFYFSIEKKSRCFSCWFYYKLKNYKTFIIISISFFYLKLPEMKNEKH